MGALYLYTKYYLLVIYHVLNFVMINKGCLVSQTMPGFFSFVDLDCHFLLRLLKQQQCILKVVKGDVGVCGLVDYISLVL